MEIKARTQEEIPGPHCNKQYTYVRQNVRTVSEMIRHANPRVPRNHLRTSCARHKDQHTTYVYVHT
eukprot:550283-Amphidinium_carterae.1